MNKNISPIEFFNQDKVNVTKRIETGRTTKFQDRNEALKYAKQRRSYIYDLYCSTFKNGSSRPVIVAYGWAVPK